MFPTSFLKFYPPSFVIRNPRTSLIKRAFKEGSQVVLLVFKVYGIKELRERIGRDQYKESNKKLKKIFKEAIVNQAEKETIISLQQHDGETFSLMVKVTDDRQSLTEIEVLTSEIIGQLSVKLVDQQKIDVQSGYMILEQGYESIDAAIHVAFQRALAVTEKRAKSDYNEMVFEIRKILNTENIKLLAQPIINVASGHVQAYEMLTRGPRGTTYESPLQLFSIARQTNMLYDLELLVLEKAFEQIKLTGSRQLIFINFTPMTLGNFRFVKDVLTILKKNSYIKTEQIIIEVTERESIDNLQHILSNIKKLRAIGFRFAVDDTGAGYASLDTISKIMPDIIKIDRSVIQDIDSNSIKESMLKGLLLIAKEAGSLVVAEGIETREEAKVLLRNNVDLAQGFYFARPNVMPKAAK